MRNLHTARKARRGHKLPAVLFACLLVLAQVQTALAQILNTVVVTGQFGDQTVTSSATASVVVVRADPRITLTKTGVFNDGGDGKADVGDTILYRFTVANAGNVTLDTVTITDPLVTVRGGPLMGLAPGTSDNATFTAVYALTQADIDAGQVANTARVEAISPASITVTATDDEVTPLVATPGIALSKTGTLDDGGDGRADAGDVITYSFDVTNTGPVTLTNVRLTDPLLDLATRAAAGRALAYYNEAGGLADPMTTASAPADLRSTITGLTPPAAFLGKEQDVAAFTTDRARAAQPVPQLPTGIHASRRLIQLSGTAGDPQPGDRIGLLYSLTNIGEAPLLNVEVRDPSSLAFGNLIDILAPGETDTGSVLFTRVLTKDDIAAGSVMAPAVVSALARNRKLLAAPSPAVAISGIEHADLLSTAAITPAAVATLLPGASTSFSATYSLTQADIDAGEVRNTATASGMEPGGATLLAVDTAIVAVPALPQIALIKSGSADLGADSLASVGDRITYSFSVTNTGNVTLTNIALADSLVAVTGGPIATLAPGDTDTTTFQAVYTLTQADLDAGMVRNQATATGTPPGGGTVSDLSDDDQESGNDPTITTLTPSSAIALVKTMRSVSDANANGVTDAGDTFNYEFAVTNTGNVSLSNVLVTDPLVVVTGGPLASLAPGITDTATFRASYVLTQADVDAGTLSNQATATGEDPAATVVQDLSDAAGVAGNTPTVTPIAEQPRIALVKSVSSITDSNGNNVNDIGDIINYAFAVTNTGNVTLTSVSVTDPLVAVSGGPLAVLLPGASDTATFTAQYTITEADARAGRITNQATATGTSPSGASISDLSDNANLDENDPTVTPVVSLPAIALVKTVDAIVNTNGNALVDAGDEIEYRFTVTNTGNVTLTNVTITDPLVAVTGGPILSLDADESDSTTFTARYVITEDDVTAGRVTNQATAFGAGPTGAVVSDLSDAESPAQDDPTVTLLANTPAIALVKSVTGITDSNGNAVTDAGDIINYAFAVTNTGNIVLQNVSVTDSLVVVNGGPLASLGVSQTDATTFTANYVITSADVDRGSVSNQAIATGFTPSDILVSDISDESSISGDDPTVTVIGGAPGIALIKQVGSITDTNGNGQTDAGDVLNYVFAVSNTGNQTLTGVTISDPLVAVTGGPLATLAAGAVDSTTFTANYTVTAADAAAGGVSNQATASGSAPSGVIVSDLSDDDVVTGNDPTVTSVVRNLPALSKTALRSEIRRGEQVPFVITAARVTAGPLRITDIMPPGFSFVTGSATANGVAMAPVINNRSLAFNGLTPDAAGNITVKLTLRAAATAKSGRYVNRAELQDPATGTVVARAQAAVTIIEEHVFDCGEIIGRVFDDKNRNGYADDGEPGLPAVRVVTVKGLLVTTDKHGRFHVPCADVPDATTGSNFLMKLDTRTLPSGYVVTSENPRDVRLTRGKVTKLNFGASILRQVMLDLKDDAFVTGKTGLSREWTKGITHLIDVLGQEPSVLKLNYAYEDVPAKLAKQRLSAVKAAIAREWSKRGESYRLVIDAQTMSVE